MHPSRRRFLRTGAIAAPVLACAALLAAPARAAVEAGPDALEGSRRPGPLPTDPRATCPLCQPGKPCPDHLV